MPRVSVRRQLISDIASGMAAASLDAEDYEDFVLLDNLLDAVEEMSLTNLFEIDDELMLGTPIDGLAEVRMLIEGNRYLTPRALYDKSSGFAKNYFMRLPDDSFSQLTRMPK
ncbi:hypothetical protein PR003_g10395 [Phytophthora rubi]|uniref:Uncharacterized protein n=1 Tax=Phytophthora rubi TaxID=129364 RepID=A0A6A4FK52_9STRA|nr:hypothetical protein PR003_g10395 [Phytophthora rubi]